MCIAPPNIEILVPLSSIPFSLPFTTQKDRRSAKIVKPRIHVGLSLAKVRLPNEKYQHKLLFSTAELIGKQKKRLFVSTHCGFLTVTLGCAQVMVFIHHSVKQNTRHRYNKYYVCCTSK